MKKFHALKSLLACGLSVGIVTSLTLTPSVSDQVSKINSFADSVNTRLFTDTLREDYIFMAEGDKWVNDIYPQTGGFNYVSGGAKYPKQPLYTIDGRGLIVNDSYPAIDLPDVERNDIYGKPVSGVKYLKWAFPFLKRTQEWKNGVLLQNTIVENLVFGSTSSDITLQSTSNPLTSMVLSPATPNLWVTAPIVEYGSRLHYFGKGTGIHHEFDRFEDVFKYLETIKSSSYKLDSLSTDRSELKDGGGSQEFAIPELGIFGRGYQVKSAIRTAEYGLSVFNDYDEHTGVLIGTHMFSVNLKDDKKYGETKMPTLQVDESLLDKKLNVASQKLDVNKLVSLANYHNLPSIAGKKVIVIRDPMNGTIKFTYHPKVYLDATNNLSDYFVGHNPITVTITGFSTANTIIKPLAQYPQDVVVDKWLDEIKTNNVIDPTKLDDYLDISTVPAGAEFTITLDPDLSKAYNYKDGIINFKIKASKSQLADGTEVDVETLYFDIELFLGARITRIVPKIDKPDKILATEMRDKLFTGDNLNVAEFNKYADFIAPVDNAKWYLKPNSYVCHTGDGTVYFEIYPDMYYDASGQLAYNTLGNIKKVFSFSLSLIPTPTIIEKKATFSPEHRVDKFVQEITNADGTVKDLTALRKYVNIEHLPSNSVLSIQNAKIEEYGSKDNRDTITFDLKATTFNNAQSVQIQNEIKTFSFKLLPQYKATDAVLKQTITNPDRVDVFKSKIETLKGDDLTTYLRQYIDFTSLHADAIVLANITNYNPYDGTLDLNLRIQQFYDFNSDLIAGIKTVNPIKMNLPKTPTKVSVIKPVDKSVRLDRFVKLFANETTGVVNNLSVLQQYVNFTVWNPTTTLTIDLDSIVMNNATGDWSGNIIMQEANDTDSNRVSNKSFPLSFQFAEKYDPTEMDKLSQYPLVQMEDFVNNLFDENGIANESIFNYVDVHSLPPNAEIELIDTKYDYPNARVELTVAISKYYDADSDLQQTIKRTRASTGFVKTFSFDLLSPPTAISVIPGYDDSVRVDRFAASFKNLTDDALQAALKDYVDFTYLPANVKLSVDQDSFSVIDLPGELSFNIIASRYFDNEGFLQTFAKAFPITLNLADKHATTSIKGKSSDELPTNLIRVDRFIETLGASQANSVITNQAVLEDYINIISLPAGAELSVDYTKDINVDLLGELNFWIKTSHYYDLDSDLQQDTSFPINLMLAPKFDPTTIKAKTTDLPNVRADRLLRTFVNSAGLVTDRKVLEQYVDIYSLPPEANLYVGDVKVNSKLGTINFNLFASHYYDSDSDVRTDSLANKNYPFPIMLQLLPKNDPTDFAAKPVLPENIIVTNLTNYIAPNNVVNFVRFSEYFDVISLPPNTNITIQEVSHSATTGAITYNINVDKYYDEEGDLHNKGNTYTVTLQLSPINDPTEIYALSTYPDVSDVATFKNYVADVDGKAIIENLQKFVGIVSLPTKSELTITWGAETGKTIDFTINASQYYDENHQLAYNKDFDISLTLASKFDPTNIKAWDTYPPIGVGVFFKQVNPQGMINYGQLSKYLDLSTVPYDAKLTISKQNANSKTGVATFTITTSAWYDENSMRHATDKAFVISLNLTPQHAATNLYAITNINKDLTLDDFWTQISSNGELDTKKLANYVNLDTLVPGTALKYLNSLKSWSGNISFDLEVDQYYDADGLLNSGKKVFKITLVTLGTGLYSEHITNYTWMYITLSLVVLAMTVTIWILIYRNKKLKNSKEANN